MTRFCEMRPNPAKRPIIKAKNMEMIVTENVAMSPSGTKERILRYGSGLMSGKIISIAIAPKKEIFQADIRLPSSFMGMRVPSVILMVSFSELFEFFSEDEWPFIFMLC
jgi:hypothetical protein